MDPSYRPPSSLKVAKLPPKAPSPRLDRDNNESTTPGNSPENLYGQQRNLKLEAKHGMTT